MVLTAGPRGERGGATLLGGAETSYSNGLSSRPATSDDGPDLYLITFSTYLY